MRRRAVGQTSFGCVVKDDETADNVSMIAAGAAFFGALLAPFSLNVQ